MILAVLALHPLAAPALVAPLLGVAAQESTTAESSAAPDVERARWRDRERELLRKIAELESALRVEQQRSLQRQQEWIAYTRLLRGFELPALPDPPEFIAEALVEAPDPKEEAEERRRERLRERAASIQSSLDALLRVEGLRGLDVLEVGWLHDYEGRTWTGPVVARLLDDRGRVVGMLKSDRMRLEVGRASRTVTLVLESGYESRAGMRSPFEGGAWLPPEAGGTGRSVVGGVRRVFLGSVDPEPWIEALPELVDPEELEPVLDDGTWDLADVRVRLVRLLRDAATSGDPSWRLVAIGGVRGDVLRDVQFAELDAITGRPRRRVFADTARLVVRDAGGIEIRLRDGTVRSGERVAPFLRGRYRIVLPRADVEAWQASPLPGIAPPPMRPATEPDAGENQRPAVR
ncbi:MAG: hypothetical protein AAGA20_18655 [Planctomycetota bacterium]